MCLQIFFLGLQKPKGHLCFWIGALILYCLVFTTVVDGALFLRIYQLWRRCQSTLLWKLVFLLLPDSSFLVDIEIMPKKILVILSFARVAQRCFEALRMDSIQLSLPRWSSFCCAYTYICIGSVSF